MWSRAWKGEVLYVCIEDDNSMIALGWGNRDFEWLVCESGDWQAIPGSYNDEYRIADDTRLRVTMRDGVYALYIDGEQVSSIVDRRFQCNKTGFRFSEGTSEIDDFTITSLD
jgi:hypothetical protein